MFIETNIGQPHITVANILRFNFKGAGGFMKPWKSQPTKLHTIIGNTTKETTCYSL